MTALLMIDLCSYLTVCDCSLAYCTGFSGSSRSKTGYEHLRKSNPDEPVVTEGESVFPLLIMTCSNPRITI